MSRIVKASFYVNTFMPALVCMLATCHGYAADELRGLRLSINFEKSNMLYKIGDPVRLNLTWTNGGTKIEKFIKPLDRDIIVVRDAQENNSLIPPTRVGARTALEHHVAVVLAPGGTDSDSIVLTRYFDLSVPSKYTVELKGNCQGSAFQSNILTFSIAWEEENARPDLTTDVNVKQLGYQPPDKRSKRSIVIIPGTNSFSIGSSPLQVEYKKVADDSWSLLRPDIASGTSVHIRQKGMLVTQKVSRPNAIFDAIQRNGNMQTFHLIPQQPKTAIKAGESRPFGLDLYTLDYAWHCGEYELWIENEQEKITSNLISFKLNVTIDSIGLLLNMAAIVPDSKDVLENHHQELRRDFAISWLIKTFPDFPLNPITDRDAQNVVDAKQEQNARFIADFRQQWETRKNSPEIKALLEKLNGGK